MGEVILQKKNLQKEKLQVNQSDKEEIIANSKHLLAFLLFIFFRILVFTLLFPLTANFKACIIEVRLLSLFLAVLLNRLQLKVGQGRC